MKTFIKCAAQGDVRFDMIEKLPEGCTEIKPCSAGTFTLSHSETGHRHMMKATPDVQFFNGPANDNMRCYLVVNKPGAIAEHMRGFDTHEPISFPAGIFEVTRQREWSPEGWRVALD